VLTQELALTHTILSERNSKSYPAWYHRRWCVERLNGGKVFDFPAELALCDLLLSRDERNFHCWNYRSFITQHQIGVNNVQKSKELIERNFSNYSAWHLRVEALLKESESMVDWDSEFALAHQAIFTEPADQSAWLFLRWLLKTRQPLTANQWKEETALILSLMEEEGRDLKWALLALVQLLAVLGEEEWETECVEASAKAYCERLKRIDPLHQGFYSFVCGMFQKRDITRVRKVLFG
jgi:geranylgeranyl transferase type-2 subunit alpha